MRDRTGLVFRSLRGKSLSNMTLSKLIKELGIAAVPHGFRSSFRDWVAERTRTPREVVDAALAHTVQNPTEADLNCRLDKLVRGELSRDYDKAVLPHAHAGEAVTEGRAEERHDRLGIPRRGSRLLSTGRSTLRNSTGQ